MVMRSMSVPVSFHFSVLMLRSPLFGVLEVRKTVISGAHVCISINNFALFTFGEISDMVKHVCLLLLSHIQRVFVLFVREVVGVAHVHRNDFVRVFFIKIVVGFFEDASGVEVGSVHLAELQRGKLFFVRVTSRTQIEGMFLLVRVVPVMLSLFRMN